MVLSMVKEQLNHNKIRMVSDVEVKKPLAWLSKGKSFSTTKIDCYAPYLTKRTKQPIKENIPKFKEK
jgi:hypothetical protein